jgi:hypothetical protein
VQRKDERTLRTYNALVTEPIGGGPATTEGYEDEAA